MHVVFLPVPIIVAALLVIEFALAIPHAIQFFSLVATAILVLLDNELPIFVLPSGLLAQLGDDRDGYIPGLVSLGVVPVLPINIPIVSVISIVCIKFGYIPTGGDLYIL